MKHFLATAVTAVFMAATLVAHADVETVHLKNGSVIHGTIIEQKPGESLKIQTRDGNIFHYEMSDVDKITKDTAQRSGISSFNNVGGAKTGYRGFLDLGYTIGVGDYAAGRLDITTTHGYQTCPYFFIGVGTGIHYYTEGSSIGVPLFADLRADFLDNWVTPFFDFKIGYSVADISGFYMCPSIGCRFGFGNNLGMHISLGYTLQKATATYYSYYYGYYGASFSYHEESVNVGGITLKVGLEF